ncbi:MAG: hypothetical protein DMG16_20315 [Acidobacteria bacterium]|nr:MAG: hypothetical protein DMG16_20315 [Acidobacteriota bacterium]
MTPAIHYALAFLLVCGGALASRRIPKQVLLLAASYMFYSAWGTGFLVILAASSFLNFVFGELLRRRQTLPRLWAGVIANVGLLCFFKYLPALAGGSPDDLIHRIVMPAGMSFWTFQALSYLFDVYHEEEIEPSLLEFLLYMSFWPTVLMGPVCRLPNMLPQFRKVHRLSVTDVTAGLRLIAIGLWMKLILAQFLGAALSRAVEMEAVWGGVDVWLIAIGFGFQLFFDFAGYSNVVIGAARFFGFEIEQNFDAPYLSTTPSMFWAKWHMSLSSWIRDYVFVPMATRRRDLWWRFFAVAFSMVLFGLWHGATVAFLLWGTYHGMLLVLHRVGQQYQRRIGVMMDGRIGSFLSWLLTFLSISLGWVLFRTNDLHQALTMLKAVVTPARYADFVLPVDYYRVVLTVVIGYFGFAVLSGSSALREKIEHILMPVPGNANAVRRLMHFSWENRWWWVAPMLVVNVIAAALIVMSQSARVTPFIYTLF